ncbi:Protein CBG21411 [Caenorhabditis briggsae]|uniref:Protein CBG21411 n=1 Tax=Caenorhabditis briggsae TaxID=6238 RepID=A8Y007_CAEBR|nr:Protein CBG21411 [Caenorhabditis briggsae]CAP38224.2 Protein CBG21411 [Caenorhabditis briggsae]
MGYHFRYLLFLTILTDVSGEEPSMTRIPGKPGIFKTSETLETSWEECMVKCRADINCSVVYKTSDIQCQYFLFGSISTIQQAAPKGVEIALKIQLSGNQCPISNPLVPGHTYYTQIIKSQFYKTTLSQDSLSNNIYNLTYIVSTCPDNTKLFQRGETIVVCIGLYFFEDPRCNNAMEASALCKAQNGTLTGPANADEYEYIQEISYSSVDTSNPDSFQYLIYWIDGAGTNTKNDYTFEDPTHNGSTNYKWIGGAPIAKRTGYCLNNPNPLSFYIADNSCTDTVLSPNAVCWRGALCQVPPKIEIV